MDLNVKLFSRLILFAAEGFGLGRIKPAPGTWGSLWGIPIGWTLAHFDATWWMCLLAGLAMFIVGVPICGHGARLRNSKDPGSIVWDEMAAFPIVFAFVPFNETNLWFVLALGFVFFRLFDVWKPPPVHHFDRLHGGFGIMIDDTVAAIYACMTLNLVVRFI